MVRIEPFLQSWLLARRDAATAVTDMPEADLAFRPTPELMTFREIAVHVLNAGHGLVSLLLDGVDNMATPDFRDKLKARAIEAEGLPAAELAERMNETLASDCAALAARDTAFFSQPITKFDGTEVTRLEMLQFVKEHELTHRSQMFLYLRLKGIVPPTTRRRLAKK